jgi:DNA-binding CsgD family transcriptional regulator
MSTSNAASLHDQIQKLSPRQMEILTLLVEGRSYEETATILSIGVNGVKKQIARMRRKTNLNKTQLIVLLAKWQMLMELDKRDNLTL